jgi:hypothetical protein
MVICTETLRRRIWLSMESRPEHGVLMRREVVPMDR